MSQLDLTVEVFNDFYKTQPPVDGSQYDIVYSFFRSYASTDLIAQNFTNFLFTISGSTGINVLTLLDEIKGKTGLEVNATIAYYLNSIKNKSVLYGTSNIPVPNYYVQRNILP